MHLGSAYASGSGAVLTRAAAPGIGQELAAAKEVLRRVPLASRVVVGDALLTRREVCEQIVAGGGNYLLPATDNEPALPQGLAEAFPPVGNWGDPRTNSAPLAGAGVAWTRGQIDGVGS